MDDHAPQRGDGSELGADTGTPRWVKVFAVVAAIVILLFVILMFTRGPGGRHGPARHFGFAGTEWFGLTVAAVTASPDRLRIARNARR